MEHLLRVCFCIFRVFSERISNANSSFVFFQRLIEKSRVTCIKWIPGSPNLFLASFSSGHLYVFNHELHCPPSAPIYQVRINTFKVTRKLM